MIDPEPQYATYGMDPGTAGSPERDRFERVMAGEITDGIRRRCKDQQTDYPGLAGVMLNIGEVLLLADAFDAAEREVKALRQRSADVAAHLRVVSDGMSSQPYDGALQIEAVAAELVAPIHVPLAPEHRHA